MSTKQKCFRKGDMRRIWFILGAIAKIERATLTTLVKETGMPKASINDVLNKLMEGQIPTLKISKHDAVYEIEDWGDLVNESAVISFYKTCKVGLSDL